ncbi:hypothetical protein AA650_00980 [Anabaena sp. WA102]|nr:hypothetical protein AA650_00980 [Anabaena sp. WA102]
MQLLLNLEPLERPGGLILEEPSIDPGHQVGDSFKITKRVGIQTETYLGNQEFSFTATVLKREVEYNGDQKIVNIFVESPDRTIIKDYQEALKALIAAKEKNE